MFFEECAIELCRAKVRRSTLLGLGCRRISVGLYVVKIIPAKIGIQVDAFDDLCAVFGQMHLKTIIQQR